MAANARGSGIDLRGPRARVGIGLLVALVGSAGLAGLFPTMLKLWARWFLMTFLFFLGMGLAMHGLANLN
jgi:hypothetical protein